MTDSENQLALARRQLEAVQRISAALYSLTDVDALQRMALQTAMDVVEADAGSLLVYDSDSNALVFRYVVGPVADTLSGTVLDLSLGSGIAGQVFRTGVPRITRNVDEDADHVGTVDARTGYRTHSLMTVPLRRRDGGTAFGVVQLVNKRTGDFDDSDVAVIEIMGSLVVMAVQNVLLAQRARLAAVAYSVGEISHDIGNMLTYVLPYVQTLEAYIADVRAGKPGAQDALEMFYGEVVISVADGVEQVESRAKEIARAVKGEVAPLVFEAGQPFRTAQHVARAFAAVAGRHQVILAADGDAELEAVFDHPRLYNALYNLVNNALPETPSKGRITLTVAPCPTTPPSTPSPSPTRAGACPKMCEPPCSPMPPAPPSPAERAWAPASWAASSSSTAARSSVQSAPGLGTTITLRLPKQPPTATE